LNSSEGGPKSKKFKEDKKRNVKSPDSILSPAESSIESKEDEYKTSDDEDIEVSSDEEVV
jgi:hypothetical protein